MCGIGGFFALQAVSPRVAAAMQKALRPRGPDAEHARGWDGGLRPAHGAWQNALLHARLSIIDPRPEADQPMGSDEGKVWIVYNGEVYGWEAAANELRQRGIVFRTHSDTEFILRAYEVWGIETLLARLRGMFAFGILDLRQGKAYLARDRMGEKPLVYSATGGDLVFGSVVRAVLPFLPPDRRELSAEGIDAYLAHRYIPAPSTVFRHIHRLENGHYLEFDLRSRQLTKTRYWKPAPEPDSWLTALDESVRMRTIADRPLGVFLSGGIDSTVIASRLAQQQLTRFRTFTAAFPGTSMDESGSARETATALGLPHTPIVVPDAVDRDFERIVADLDEPFADPSSFPTWYLAREVSKEVKVVLVGDGGDELFGGYKRIAKHLRTAWRRDIRIPFRIPPAMAGRKLITELALDWNDAYSLRFSGFAPAQRAFLQARRELPSLSYWRQPDREAGDPLQQLLAIDLANYLPEYILRKSDLCTMAHGLEARAPLLDHHFVQRIASLRPEQLYTRPPKKLLQAAMDPRLPAGYFDRKKRGFNPPLREWLQVKLADRLKDLGARLEHSSAGQLAAGPVDAFLRYYLKGAEHAAERVLQLLILDESLAQLGAVQR
jgi:asparagine synthase (glutamine-hydrolysing)